MVETAVTMTELRQNLGEFVNRAAYGDERIVLHAHGQPKAVIVSYEEFERLQSVAAQYDTYQDPWDSVLETATVLRERIQERYKVAGIVAEDSTDVLRQLREDRSQ
jgi:prevent-host-death family protein